MNEVPKDLSKSKDLQSCDASLLELASSSSDGWNTEDLKQVLSSAQNLKSKKTAAYIKAVAKLAMLSKQCGFTSQSFAQQIFSLNPSNRLIRENSDYLVVEVSANFRLPKIPLGYGFKGGAARIALSNVLGRNTQKLRARDFDLVRFSQGSLKQDQQIAARVMCEDFSHGHGVEVVKGLEQYFQSRDLTINEVLLVGKKVIFTRAAFRDLQQGALRVSNYLLNSDQAVPGKILCKILRIAAELAVSGAEYKLVDFPKGAKVTAKDIELHRIRALDIGTEVEKKYTELCAKWLCNNLKITTTNLVAKPIRPASRSLRLQNEFRLRRKHS